MSAEPHDPVTELQAALDALPDDHLDAVTRMLARCAALPVPILADLVAAGETEARRRELAARPSPPFPGDGAPERPYRQPIVEDMVGRPDIVWPRGT